MIRTVLGMVLKLRGICYLIIKHATQSHHRFWGQSAIATKVKYLWFEWVDLVEIEIQKWLAERHTTRNDLRNSTFVLAVVNFVPRKLHHWVYRFISLLESLRRSLMYSSSIRIPVILSKVETGSIPSIPSIPRRLLSPSSSTIFWAKKATSLGNVLDRLALIFVLYAWEDEGAGSRAFALKISLALLFKRARPSRLKTLASSSAREW